MAANVLHVALGIIRNKKKQVLLSQRSSGVPHGGLWEFPGGKLKPGETTERALARELKEELGLIVKSAKPLIKIQHHDLEYSGQPLVLDAWDINDWQKENEIYGREGQVIRWVYCNALDTYNFPRANKAIIKAVQLPAFYLICPEPDGAKANYIETIEKCLSAGVKLLQLRFKNDKSYEKYSALIRQLAEICHSKNAKLLINSTPENAIKQRFQGIHLSSTKLMQLTKRPLNAKYWIGASCHNAGELKHAQDIGVDFAVLSPVKITPSHRNAEPIGWHQFGSLVKQTKTPVYALGGMQPEDLKIAKREGAQGISVLSGVWNANDLDKKISNYLNQ